MLKSLSKHTCLEQGKGKKRSREEAAGAGSGAAASSTAGASKGDVSVEKVRLVFRVLLLELELALVFDCPNRPTSLNFGAITFLVLHTACPNYLQQIAAQITLRGHLDL